MRDRTGVMKGRMGGCFRRATGLFVGSVLLVLPVVAQERPVGQWPQQTPVVYSRLPSENTALTLSVVGTVATLASFYTRNGYLVWGGIVFGPSLGFFYGDCWGRGLLSAGLRFGASLAAIAVAYEDDLSDTWGYVWLGGMALSTIVDLATVRRAVHRQNERRMARRKLNLDVSPFAMPKGGGVQLKLSF